MDGEEPAPSEVCPEGGCCASSELRGDSERAVVEPKM